MAASDATPIPIKNQAYRVTFPIYDNDGDLVTGAAGLDSEISKDAGIAADCTNEATEIATSFGIYYLDLTATEMNADTVAIKVKSTTTDSKDTVIILYPQDSGADRDVNVTHWNGTAVATPTIGGVPEVDVTHWLGSAPAALTDTDKVQVSIQHQGVGVELLDSGGSVGTSADELVDDIWDEVNTTGAHNINNSTGKQLRESTGALTITAGTCQVIGQTTTNVRIAASESSTDDIFNFKRIVFVGGTNSGFDAIITDYDGTNKDCTISPALPSACDNTTEYNIVAAIAHTETQKPGYAGAAVYIDTVNGTAGTELYVNGTADNPSSNIADALTLASALNFARFSVLPNSSITFAADMSNYAFEGNNYTIAFGGQTITGAYVSGATVSGTFVGTTAILEDCIINAITGAGITMRRCFLNDVFTMSGAGVYVFNDAQAAGSTSLATLDFNSLAATASFQRWSGDLTVNNLVTGATLRLHCTSGGTITLNGADATVIITGNVGSVVNNLTGLPTVTDNSTTLTNINAEVDTAISDAALATAANLATVDTVVDGIQSDLDNGTDGLGAIKTAVDAVPTAVENRTEMDSNSTQLAAIVEDTGTTLDTIVDNLNLGIIYGAAQTGTLSTTQATTDLTGYADDQLIGRILTWTSGACGGEQTDITDYANISGTLTFTALTTAPANNDTFKIT